MSLKSDIRVRSLSAVAALLLSTVPCLILRAAPLGLLFSDDFESAASVSPYTIAQQQANSSLATDSDPGPAQVGAWFTYPGEADGGPGLFGVQVTSNVDPSYTGAYQGSNVLRIFRSPSGSGAAAAANFATTQYGGKVRATWMEMLHPSADYECMIHLSGTENPGGEGFDTARLSLVIHSSGSCAYYAGGWIPINGLTATMNKWQNHQLDIDLDTQKWTWTIDGVTSGEISGFGNAPGTTAASMIFRGGGGANDLFYIDSLKVVTVPPSIVVTKNGNQLSLSWAGSGLGLQENDNLANPSGWSNVVNGGTSPVLVTTSASQKFYRLSPLIAITDCQSLQAAIYAQMAAGGGVVTVPAGMTIPCASYQNPIDPSLQSKQSLLIREGVTLDLNGSTIQVAPTETAYGVRLDSHTAIKNGTVQVVNYVNQSSQSVWNSAISVGSANGEEGGVTNLSHFNNITDWRIENITVGQPFARSAIQVMGGSNHGLITNVTILDSPNAWLGIGFDWGTIGPITTADAQIQHMRDLFDQGIIYSTHPHDIVIDGVHIGILGNDATDDQAGIRTAGCYNFTIRNVTVAGAHTGIALRPGDLGFEFALEPDRSLAHANYSVSNFTLLNIRGKGLILDGLSDNVWRASLNYGYVPLIDPTYPGLKGAVIQGGTFRGTGTNGSYGIYSFANSSCVLSNLDVQGFETGARLYAWINGSTLKSNTIAHNKSWGVILGISGPEAGVTDTKNVVMMQSQIFRNGEGDPNTGGVVISLSEGVTVTNNTIGSVGLETQHYGIYVSNTATNATVLPNTFGATAPGGTPLYIQP